MKAKINFDFEKMEWENILAIYKSKWIDAYPLINIEQELKRAAVWLLANPKKKKKNYHAFLNNWFSRANTWRECNSFEARKVGKYGEY